MCLSLFGIINKTIQCTLLSYFSLLLVLSQSLTVKVNVTCAWIKILYDMVVASVTGLEEIIIKRFHVIMQVISSGYDINIQKFNEYAVETARMFVNMYPWYYMPNAVHKLLIHGSHIISSALLPIGQLSEDAQEARNKDIKMYRKGFSRKCSRESTMEDVFNWLLITSDPYISCIRKLPKKHFKFFLPEAISLLICTSNNLDADYNSNDSESD